MEGGREGEYNGRLFVLEVVEFACTVSVCVKQHWEKFIWGEEAFGESGVSKKCYHGDIFHLTILSSKQGI